MSQSRDRAATPLAGRLGGPIRGLALCALVLPLVAAALRLAGLQRVRRLLCPRYAAGRRDPVQAAQLARRVKLAARPQPLGASCLARSVLLEALLLRHGLDARLRIGSVREGGGLLAHAWVEHGGVPLNDAADVAERYLPFPDLPAAGGPGRP